jgi:penicillin-binding protein 1C
MKVESRIMTRIVSSVLMITLLSGLIIANITIPDYGNALREQRLASGISVFDRNGELLRVIPRDDQTYQVWVEIDRIPAMVRRAFVAAEDKRFHYHPGFDPIATIRALITNLYFGRIVSGASTITQQVVRLIHPRPRTWRSKLIELICAIRMELQLTKSQILELYLNMTPTGGNIRGVELAAHMYFSKSLEGITAPEAAFMAVTPRSPTKLDPRNKKGRQRAKRAKEANLELMAKSGWLDEARLERLKASKLEYQFSSFPLEAPHLVDHVLSTTRAKGRGVHTHIDLSLQRSAEKIVGSHRNRLSKLGVTQAAIMIVSARSAQVLSMVGSMEYGPRNGGYNNGALARRSAGSTLKPFLYGLAIQDGYHALTRVSDTLRSYPTPHGEYLPLNADRRSYGPVSIRTALGNSLNLSAVKTLERLGLESFYSTLKDLDLVEDETKEAAHYGLGMAIGNIEVSLEKLCQAYLTMANGGVFRKVKYTVEDESDQERVFDEASTFIVNRILSDPSARMLTFGNPETLAFGYPVCVKTGTSAGYRDCWIVGFTPEHIIGVWAGNFNGSPNFGVTGVRVCGPILKDLIKHIYGDRGPSRFLPPKSAKERWVCWISNMRAADHCKYKYKELFRSDSSEALPICNLVHEEAPRIALDTRYAKWLHKRKIALAEGRYRLAAKTGERRKADRKAPENLVQTHYESMDHGLGVRILSPHTGDHFVLSAEQRTRVRLRAIVRPVADYLIWHLDGVEIKRTGPPYEFFWKPVRGAHSISAVTPDGAGDKIHIMVE